MVLIPFFADQPANAKRADHLEIAHGVRGLDLTPEKLREALPNVLDERRYRDDAGQLRSELQTMLGLEQGVGLLERLVDQH